MFGLTSNALDTVHAPQILEALAKYKIRWVSCPQALHGWGALSLRCSRFLCDVTWGLRQVDSGGGYVACAVLAAVACWETCEPFEENENDLENQNLQLMHIIAGTEDQPRHDIAHTGQLSSHGPALTLLKRCTTGSHYSCLPQAAHIQMFLTAHVSAAPWYCRM